MRMSEFRLSFDNLPDCHLIILDYELTSVQENSGQAGIFLLQDYQLAIMVCDLIDLKRLPIGNRHYWK